MDDTAFDTDADIARRERELASLRARRAERTTITPDGEPDTDVDWPHRTVDFAGEEWQVRTPGPDALSALSMASSRHTPAAAQIDITSGFFSRHLSPASYARFLDRWSDPDDDGITSQTLRDLMALMVGDPSRPSTPS